MPSKLDDRAGVVGAAMLAIEHVLAPAAIDREIAASEAEPASAHRVATA